VTNLVFHLKHSSGFVFLPVFLVLLPHSRKLNLSWKLLLP